MDLPLSGWALLILAGVLAGFMNAVAGGGGVLSLPALLAVGLPPHLALGTNKLQASFGTLAATLKFHRADALHWRPLAAGIAWTALGAVLGALAVQNLPADGLRRLVPILLVAILIYTLVLPDLGSRPSRARCPRGLFGLLAGLSLGFYDGFFGPGVGSFWTLAWISLAGATLREATVNGRVMNAASNVASLAVFLAGGQVWFAAGLAMGAAQAAGAWLGAHLALVRGHRFIRAVFLVAVAATLARALAVSGR